MVFVAMKKIVLSFDELDGISRQSLRFYWANHLPVPSEPDYSHRIAILRQILYYNLKSGRWAKVVGSTKGNILERQKDIQTYARIVVEKFEEQHPRVYSLERGETAVWQQLRSQLAGHTQRILRSRYGISESLIRNDTEEYVQMACETIFRTRFPFDVPFDAWAAQILLNHIRQRLWRSSDMLDHREVVVSAADFPLPSEFEENELWERLVPDCPNTFDVIDNRSLLVDLIERLPSAAQKEVILLTFFYDWEDPQIAGFLEKSVQAVYNLRHRALKCMKYMLDQLPKSNG